MNRLPGGRWIEFEDIGHVTVVRFTQRRVLDDANLPTTCEELFRMVDELGRDKILIDSGSTDSLTSIILGSFVRLHNKLKLRHGRLAFGRINRDLHDMFRIMKLDRLFCVAPDPPFSTLEAVIAESFGNPYRPVTFAAEWRTDTAIALARTMYEAREFSAMPILADALQDAGCDSDDVLNHCRDTKQPHVRGCWVCELVLGKE